MKRILLYTLAFLFATLQTFAQTTYTYDDLNRLTKVVYGNGVTVTYTYDALGNRISKKVTGASNPKEAYAWMSSDGKTLTFCYDDMRSERNGVTYDMNTGYNYAGWNPDPWSTVSSVTTVVFESSFASVRPTSMYTWFCNFQNLKKIAGLNYLNTSEVTNMFSLFRDCKSLTSLDLSHFNTSNVTKMAYMFDNCSQLTSLDVSSFDTSNVDDMAGMFTNCSSLTILDVSHFNTFKVERFTYMFEDCSSLTSLDVSNFDTSNIRYSYSMFRDCSSLRTLSISPTMGNIDDEACSGIGTSSSPCTLIAPDGFDYGVDTSGNYFEWKSGYFKMYGSKEAYAVYINGTLTFYYDDAKSSREGTVYNDLNTDNNFPGWCDHNDITKVVFDSSFADARPTTTKCWFYYLENMTSMEGMEYLNTSKVTNMAYMFDGCSSLTSLDVSHFDTSNVEDMYSMFSGCSSLTSLDVSHFDTSNVKDMAYLFNRCNGLTGLDVSHFNTSKVTNMRYMFEYCKSLTSLDVSNFDTSNVTDMCCMFDLCWSLTSLDVSHFNTSNVTNMSWMFYYCCAPNLDVSHFDTSKVTNMSAMFYACFYLTSLDVSHFDTSNVTNMSSMFSQCEALTDLDVSNFDTSKCEDTGRMFFYCHSLKSLALSSTMENLDETACDRVGSTSSPCTLIAPEGFDFGVDISANYFEWKSGYFKMYGAKEVYAWLSNDGKTLTFCYDGKRSERNGETYDMNTEDYVVPGWCVDDFSETSSIREVVFEPSFADARPINTSYWFVNMANLSEIKGLNYLNTSNVAKMYMMFSGCSNLAKLDLSHFNTSKVTTMSEMFYGCKSLASVNLSHFDTSNVVSMNWLFYDCSNLKSIDLSAFDFSKATDDTYAIIGRCSNLTNLVIPPSMENVDDEACWQVGSRNNPCAIIAPDGFDFGVDTSGDYFYWKGGFFKVSNSSGFANGDVNHDTEVNVVDVMLTVNYVLKKETPDFHFENADVNGNGVIDVVDIMGIVNIILKKPARAHSVPTIATSDRIEAFPMSDGIGLSLSNAQRYTALEMTLTLPPHATIAKATLNGSTNHSVVTQALGDGMYRVVVYSLTGETLPNSDALIHLTISGAGNININDVLLTNTFFEAIAPLETTGISIYAGTNSDDSSPAYRTDGVRAMPTHRGVIIHNGRKQARKQ